MDLEVVWKSDKHLNAAAVAVADTVLTDPRTVDRLAAYYTVNSNYAGATFVSLAPVDPHRVTATDLLAVTTLSVSIHPRAIRSFEETGEVLTGQLARLDPELRLENVEPSEVAPLMADLYETVKGCLRRAGAQGSNAWVTASKICARKRPDLFPVRDNVVLDLLGLPKYYPVDWPAYQTLAANSALMEALDECVRAAANADGVNLGDPARRLRHLDVALWMHATRRD